LKGSHDATISIEHDQTRAVDVAGVMRRYCVAPDHVNARNPAVDFLGARSLAPGRHEMAALAVVVAEGGRVVRDDDATVSEGASAAHPEELVQSVSLMPNREGRLIGQPPDRRGLVRRRVDHQRVGDDAWPVAA
jgi:hypothetical protein